ncbi:MAG: alpha/beta hydrolase [Gemmatimonadota bacterium]|nr:MAG: alpha/beta hydrolase [Gemmatimonadota bacterium]
MLYRARRRVPILSSRNQLTLLLAVAAFVVVTCTSDQNHPASGFIEVDDSLHLYYTTAGSGADTVVIPAAMYLAEDLGILAPGRTLIFYDMRGRGRSSRVLDGSKLGLQFEIDDLERVRRHFKIGRMSLIGFSYLGAVVVLYAAEYPDRVERIVQMGPMPPRSVAPYMERSPPTSLIDSSRVRTLREIESSGALLSDPVGHCTAYWRAYLVMYVGDPAIADSINLPCNLRNEWPQNFSVTYQHLLDKLPQWDWRSVAAEVSVPALTIHGELDNIAPPGGGREWALHLPNARLLYFSSAGHLIWAEQTDELLRVIDQFLRGEWPAGPEELTVGPP